MIYFNVLKVLNVNSQKYKEIHITHTLIIQQDLLKDTSSAFRKPNITQDSPQEYGGIR